jgi:hypothetical protein
MRAKPRPGFQKPSVVSLSYEPVRPPPARYPREPVVERPRADHSGVSRISRTAGFPPE